MKALASRRIVTPQGIRDGAVLIEGGKVFGLVGNEDIPKIDKEDFGNWIIMPGLVDCHVHINDPGRAEWEGFETASYAAAAGGITTLIDMPLNSIPVTTTLNALHKKTDAASGKLQVDCGFYGGLVPGNSEHLTALSRAGVFGFKSFLIHSGIDDFPAVTPRDLRLGMSILAHHDKPLLVHAELECDHGQNKIGDPRLYPTYLKSRPPAWENEAIRMMIGLCRETGCQVHIVHLSSSEALDDIRRAKDRDLPLTVETCPHYLFFEAEEIGQGQTCYKCAPPIRERENRRKLWNAVTEGLIDFVVSDHSPCLPQLKLLQEGDFMKAWGGISSVQLGLSTVWTQGRKLGISPVQIAEYMGHRPARFLGLGGKKGSLEKGADADIVIWDPDASYSVEPSMIHHRHKVTPYSGATLFGRVQRTYLRGEKIFEKGLYPSSPRGKILWS